MKEIFNENYIDLGVAHGLINVLQILYKIYRKYNYSQAKNGMNILIDFYYNLMLRFDGKIDSLERISSDKILRMLEIKIFIDGEMEFKQR